MILFLSKITIMNRFIAVLIGLALAFPIHTTAQSASQTGFTPNNSPAKVVIDEDDIAKARELAGKMTLDEKIAYISGVRSFFIRGVERIGIPEIRMADGPQGVRNNTKSTLYPCGIMTASTWNRDLALELGRSLAVDCNSRGVSILLGPGVNIYRSPMCGRNFEYFGEDPYLASETAVGYILGLQEKGVIATIKHFAANNQEWSRHHVSSDVDERTFHEIYFPAFRKAVQEAGVGAVMNSYNLVWGVHASENSWLNNDVLRQMWGFNGLVMSDWTSTYSALGMMKGGLDLEMPKDWHYNKKEIIPLLEKGMITEEEIDEKVCNILQTLSAFGLLDGQKEYTKVTEDNPLSSQTALEIAREGIVLLKNEGGILPLNRKKDHILVLGPNAEKNPHGGGSGAVDPFHNISVHEGLKQLMGDKRVTLLSDKDLYESIDPSVYPDRTSAEQRKGENGFKADYYLGIEMKGEPVHSRVEPSVTGLWKFGSPFDDMPDDGYSVSWEGFWTAEQDGKIRAYMAGDDGYRLFIDDKHIGGHWSRHGLSSKSFFFDVKKGKTYKFRFDFFEAAGEARAELNIGFMREDKLRDMAQKASAIVYCGGFNADLEGEGFDRPFELPESQIDDINKLSEINSNIILVLNAGGAVDFRNIDSKVPAIMMAWYPGQEGGKAMAELLTGEVCPSGRLPISMENAWQDNPTFNSYYDRSKAVHKRVFYSEGVFLGYRGLDHNNISPRFAFGHGLSYTSFKYSNMEVKQTGDSVKVSFDITNTGRRDGKEVAQVYVGDMEASVPRPEKELKHYSKVFIPKGKTVHVELALSEDAFSFYDVKTGEFIAEPGRFTISVGGSSDNLPLKEEIILQF